MEGRSGEIGTHLAAAAMDLAWDNDTMDWAREGGARPRWSVRLATSRIGRELDTSG
jgi:hypothetical protein